MPTFTNWGRTHRCDPEQILRPGSEDEVLEIVQRARAAGRRIRCVGAGHSWSDIAMCDQILLNLDRMDQVIAVDAQRQRITVQAGIRLRDLNAELDARGLAMSILGSVVAQSVAGAIATGTHGSSARHGNLASAVVGLRLVTGAGEILSLDEGDPRLAALRVGLGCGGVVTEVTLQVEPAFRLRERSYSLPFDEGCDRMDELVDAHEYVKFWWFPHTRRLQVFAYDRTEEPANNSALARWFDEGVLNRLVFPLVLALGGRSPERIPRLNRMVCAVAFQDAEQIAPSDLAFTLAMPPVHRETEWAIPRSSAAESLRRLRALIDERGFRVNFIQEVRFVRADDAWMSPAYGRETCQIGAYIGPSPSADAFLTGAQEIFRALDGRPHWGKEFDTRPDEIRARCPRAAEFAALIRELDPDGCLTNPFTERVLGPG